jgi:hypothetical protein
VKLAKTDHLHNLKISEVDAMFSFFLALLEFAKSIVKIELALLDESGCPFPSR